MFSILGLERHRNPANPYFDWRSHLLLPIYYCNNFLHYIIQNCLAHNVKMSQMMSDHRGSFKGS